MSNLSLVMLLLPSGHMSIHTREHQERDGSTREFLSPLPHPPSDTAGKNRPQQQDAQIS